MLKTLRPDENRFAPCPESIAVIGGGRWARVLTEVLCNLIPTSVRVSVHTLHNAESVSVWLTERGLEGRIHLSSEWPQFLSGRSNAVIVANAARDHEGAVQWALSAGVPVLVEKPIALSAVATQRLADLSIRKNVRFAAAHVFLFARYIDHFSKLVANAGNIRSLRVHWTDPKFENRYGEQKHYDSSLPIFSDCLPHILSIIGTLTHNLPDKCEITKFLRGGACLELELMLGDTPCSICLERNSDQRRRLITAIAGQKMLLLNFSKEPGIITDGSTTMVGDPDWEVKQRPVAQMLTAFLKWVTSGEYDSRLDVEVGLRACQVIDKILDKYRSAMKSWLVGRLSSAEPIDDDLRYALYEILQSEGRLSETAVDKQIELVRQQFSGADGTRLLTELTNLSYFSRSTLDSV